MASQVLRIDSETHVMSCKRDTVRRVLFEAEPMCSTMFPHGLETKLPEVSSRDFVLFIEFSDPSNDFL